MSNSPGPVDFAIGVVIFVLKLPDGQVLFFGEIQITEGLQSILLIKKSFEASWNDLWASTYQLQLSRMAGCKTDFLCTLLPECQKPVFLMFRKFRFSLGNMPPAPYFIVHQKAILPHQNAKFACHHINKLIKNNMAVLKWYSSNAVNIL